MPSSLSNILLIARREYLERVRAKSFVVMTILIPVVMGALIGGAAMMNRNLGSASHLAVVTDDTVFANNLQTELTNSDMGKPQIDVHSPAEPGVRDHLDAQLKDKHEKLDGYLVVTPTAAGQRPSFEWVPRVKSDIVTRSRVASAARAAYTREQLSHDGMAASTVNELMQPVDLSPKGKEDHTNAAVASAYGMYFLMYFVILFYGMNVARSIIEEKTSRIFEVLLATIQPEEMLAGKMLGVGAVGLTQVGIWLVIALAAFKIQVAGLDLHVLPTAPQAALFVVFFLLGYMLYSSIAAALGAMNNSEQELQQMQMIMMLPLIISSVVIFKVITDPNGPIARVFSYIPFTTPLIMYTRVIVGNPTPVEVIGSIIGLVVTILAVLWVASRIYRVGILMYGKKPNLPEILRWLKYS
ncbi:MAG: ABC transporter permease [Acidobacteriaceae bacterium]|nr:ABC transporter permease [Acidobacteriaceae bacterium]